MPAEPQELRRLVQPRRRSGDSPRLFVGIRRHGERDRHPGVGLDRAGQHPRRADHLVTEADHIPQAGVRLAVFGQAGGVIEMVVAEIEDHPLAGGLEPAGELAILVAIGLGEHHRAIAVEPGLLELLGRVTARLQEGDRLQHAIAVGGDGRIGRAGLEGEGHESLPDAGKSGRAASLPRLG